MPLIIVNLTAYASSIDKIIELTDLPIMQDNNSVNAAQQYGAAKWYTMVIRADGSLYKMHYDLPMPTQLGRLRNWILEAKGESP